MCGYAYIYTHLWHAHGGQRVTLGVFLVFHLFWDNLLSNWPMSFQGFFCLYLPSPIDCMSYLYEFWGSTFKPFVWQSIFKPKPSLLPQESTFNKHPIWFPHTLICKQLLDLQTSYFCNPVQKYRDFSYRVTDKNCAWWFIFILCILSSGY